MSINQYHPFDLVLLKRKSVEAITGYSRSTIYQKISEGEFPPPVAIGSKSVAWPKSEIMAINAARIAGKSNTEIRVLVKSLTEKRVHATAGGSHA